MLRPMWQNNCGIVHLIYFLCYAIPIFFHLCTYIFVRIFLSSRLHNTLLEDMKQLVTSLYRLDNLRVSNRLDNHMWVNLSLFTQTWMICRLTSLFTKIIDLGNMRIILGSSPKHEWYSVAPYSNLRLRQHANNLPLAELSFENSSYKGLKPSIYSNSMCKSASMLSFWI